MLLRKSIFNARRLFQKTLHSFKSFFSTPPPPPPPYQRIPKTPPSYSYTTPPVGIDVDMNARTSFNNVDFTNPGNDKEKAMKRNHEKQTSPVPSSSSSSSKQGKGGTLRNRNFIKARREDHYYVYNKKNLNNHHNTREGRSCLVKEKLKELEMMDISNVDHVLDIEEVLHYYSRLTCPAYLDIVDKFFMDMYAEFFGHQPVTPRSVNSKPRLVRSFRS